MLLELDFVPGGGRGDNGRHLLKWGTAYWSVAFKGKSLLLKQAQAPNPQAEGVFGVQGVGFRDSCGFQIRGIAMFCLSLSCMQFCRCRLRRGSL